LPLPELYRRVERHIPPFEWPILADDIAAIPEPKEERHAVILANNYQTPDIFHTVADIVGDSPALAREAARTEADVIVLAGVHFMAETARVLNPDKVVLIPDLGAGAPLRRRSRQPISGSCASAIRAHRS
jgi:quinolinate synthase